MMQQRFILAAVTLGFLAPWTTTSRVAAQTLRFQTNVGSFDMRLNPGNDANLRPLVDNIIAYVGLGRYHYSAINRAADGNAGTADDFVLQMGGFLAFPPASELWTDYLTSVEALPAVVVDADNDGDVDFDAISNTRGTVSLALSAGNPNSGTSSFFINLGNNASLDAQGFVPFAEIVDMATIDAILALQQLDLSTAAGSPGNLAFIDVPTVERSRLVVVTDVTVIDAGANFSFVGPIASALQMAQRQNGSSNGSNNSNGSNLSSSLAGSGLSASGVPEPSSLLLAASALGFFGRRRGRRKLGRG